MDDITPLQQFTDGVARSDVHLFKPRPTYRLHSVAGGSPGVQRAYINYLLTIGSIDGVPLRLRWLTEDPLSDMPAPQPTP
jgi:hypothetical protein